MSMMTIENQTVELAGRRIHFVGIGGCGMSGLARLAQARGAVCGGTDMGESQAIQTLREAGVPVSMDQTGAAIAKDCELVVISAAIRSDHPEVLEAERRGVRVIKYAEMLGRLMARRCGVAIAGTHGKSTTTSLLSHVLIETGLDPSFIVGANCRQIGGGARAGASEVLVAEACEFDRSFHHLQPRHGVILNVEEDHLDVYGSIDEIVEAFAVFAQKLPTEGSLLIQHESSHRLAITAGLACDVQTIGFAPQADWRVQLQEPQQDVGGRRETAVMTRLFEREVLVATWRGMLPGEHMAYNAAAAAVLAHRLGARWEGISHAIEQFEGLDRRMQRLGYFQVAESRGRALAVDDYGHHPTEIDTTLRALKRHYQPGRLICVFQPHQHSRTRFLLEQFARSFSEADIVIVPEIYFVRDSEAERHAVCAADLVDRLRRQGKAAMHLYPFDAIVEQLRLVARDGDLIVTMGAGDVWKVAHAMVGAEMESERGRDLKISR